MAPASGITNEVITVRLKILLNLYGLSFHTFKGDNLTLHATESLLNAAPEPTANECLHLGWCVHRDPLSYRCLVPEFSTGGTTA